MGKNQAGLLKNISGLNVFVARWLNMSVRVSGHFPVINQFSQIPGTVAPPVALATHGLP
jgi:hypothetical protein